MSYCDEVKNCQLSTQGYYKDLSSHFDNAAYDVNDGASHRSKCFRTNYDDSKPYREDGAKFFGRLHLDLVSIDTGLPFGTKVHIELEKSKDSFVLMREPTDTENYKIVITHCYLYVPIAQLSIPVYNELSSIMTTKSVALHFRKTEIRPLTIPAYKTEFCSDNLFPGMCLKTLWPNKNKYWA